MEEQFHHGLLTAELPVLRNCSVQAYRSDGTCVATTFEDVVNELAMGSTRQVAIASQFATQSTRDEGNGLKSIAHGYHDPAYYDPPPVSHVEQAIEALADALPRCGKGFSFVTAQRWADAAPIVTASEHKPDLVLVLNESRRSGWS